ncbi:MAG: hypothetical protein OEY94_05105 [Alphaproteobacteria bacterium]|nr:hypothetical protein [Alphaproteobacteria bacterium]
MDEEHKVGQRISKMFRDVQIGLKTTSDLDEKDQKRLIQHADKRFTVLDSGFYAMLEVFFGDDPDVQEEIISQIDEDLLSNKCSVDSDDYRSLLNMRQNASRAKKEREDTFKALKSSQFPNILRRLETVEREPEHTPVQELVSSAELGDNSL